MRPVLILLFATAMTAVFTAAPRDGGSAMTIFEDDRDAAQIYMTVDGNDSWSGDRPRPNRRRTDGPVATVEGARAAIRRLLTGDTPPARIVVTVGIGVYRLAEPVVFTAEDTADGACEVEFRAEREGLPVWSGGVRLTGWTPIRHRGMEAWQLQIPEVAAGEWNFRQLFVDGERRARTRLPETGFYQFVRLPEVDAETRWQQGQTQAVYANDDIQPWTNLEDVEIKAMHLWVETHLPIRSVDVENRVVHFAKTSQFRLTDDNMGTGVAEPGCRYYVENVVEALDQPGEWYLDRKTGTLTYLPRPGEDPATTEIIAPRLAELVRFQGAKRLTLRGLTLSHTEWAYGADLSGSPQAAVFVPGAVTFDNAADCALRFCTVNKTAGYAVVLENGSARNGILRCHLHDLGAGGVRAWETTSETEIADCVIAHGGRLFPSGVGVLIGNSGNNTVIHNRIHDLYYTGISVGWRWGYGESAARGNIIEHNHIHDIGHGLLSDMGGIYTLGISPGTLLRYNHIHDIQSYRYGGWGLYTDEGSSGILLENNLVYRTRSAGFHQHYGRENVIRNNIFAFGEEAGLMRTRVEDHLSFVFERNIVLSDNGRMAKGGGWERGKTAMINNLYYDLGGNPLDFAGGDFEAWRGREIDYQSRIADPLFMNPGEGDFTLKGGSPALDLGFAPFDIGGAGPRPLSILRYAPYGAD